MALGSVLGRRIFVAIFAVEGERVARFGGRKREMIEVIDCGGGERWGSA